MNIIYLLILGLAAGTLSGFLGLGGGAVVVPALIYIFGMTQREAQGTTLAMMIPPIGLLAAIKYYQNGNVNIKVALFICFGFVIGGYLGAVFAHYISELWLKKFFGIFLLFIAIKMIFIK